MNEFFNYIFSAPNIIPTAILAFCVVYWLIVIVGIIDLDLIDFDVDVDADMDVEADAGGGTEAGVAWLNRVLHFFNLGRIPFMLWLSIIMFLTWIMVIFANRLLLNSSFILGLLFFGIALIAAMVIAKPLMFPLVKMFDALEKSDGLKTVIGQLAEVVYPNKGAIPGEVEITFEGSKIRIFALPSDPKIELERYQRVLVIAPTDNDVNIYIVEPYK